MKSFESLSPLLQKLLIDVKSSQTDGGHHDRRGFYAEFDSDGCKPYLHTTILEAQKLDWLDIHPQSDEARELEEPYINEIEHELEDEYGNIVIVIEEEEVIDYCSGVCIIKTEI
ncbi:hypothetical protein [Vibrio parahaemolyticus]|uniref:hypothetical protein n=1 Tax=Vibrio parahaemolyticus TaxID=670 RepID=UPI0022699A3C|nr:hypothetical protein [Vibrio parahaemolyticus]MCX8796134.1 hypothetical protein [Vibrio parahaemolyticus]